MRKESESISDMKTKNTVWKLKKFKRLLGYIKLQFLKKKKLGILA